MSTPIQDKPAAFEGFQIIGASGLSEEEPDGTWNLYTPEYGDTFLGNFRTVQQAAIEAVRLGGDSFVSVEVL